MNPKAWEPAEMWPVDVSAGASAGGGRIDVIQQNQDVKPPLVSGVIKQTWIYADQRRIRPVSSWLFTQI